MTEIREVNPIETREFRPPVEASKMENVGDSKTMETKATLLPNGFLTLETMSRNEALTEGLRGKVFAVGLNDKGEAVWVSEQHECKTRGSKLDLTSHNTGKDVFSEKVPESAARETRSIQIFQGEGDMKDTRERWIENLQRGAEAVKQLEKTLEA